MITSNHMTYLIDFRRKVLTIREKEGLTYEQTAERFGVGIASLTRWAKRLEPRPAKRRRRKIDMDELARDVELFPDSYQYERAQRFGVVQNSIHQGLKRLNVTYKKSPEAPQGGRTATYRLPPAD